MSSIAAADGGQVRRCAAAAAPSSLLRWPLSSSSSRLRIRFTSLGFRSSIRPSGSIGSGASELKDSVFPDEELKAPPLDSEELILYPDPNEMNSTSDDLAAPPLEPEELKISAENSDSNEVESSGGDLENITLQPEVPDLSISMVSPSHPRPPPFPGTFTKTKEPISLRETDRQLIYAKEEIGHAPTISNDPDLYAPLFRNVSVFKRSYELMEKTLKVYIYRYGRRPIFHTPALKGIYASEGWFMKLLEGNKQFVVKDPNIAHLFYLPFSARQLEVYLYKPGSHSLRPLAIFVKNYVDWISAKHPFWNRTGGADHFLVACHDWGPYTTNLHTGLGENSIRALCNADPTVGFIRGKDVSLPETLIINPKKALRGLGGKAVSKRSILAFFAGNMHGRVRPILLNYWKEKDEDMKIYGPLPPQVSKKMSYIQHMKSSKFCICPMGYEVNSPRIVEAIYYECVPVIIADNFVLPFDEVLDWSVFSVVVAEKDIPQLKDILLKITSEKYVDMHENVKRLQRHFLWHPRPVKYDIFHMILHSIWFNRLNRM
ncbi:uncharacterized protein A4U43_C06F6170 [Asparagus officinalis]|uniref:Exostosin GT47 domain-containing protein n=1 Tax=Asparagus officinalis TaxID=4686 RepID=A0A5P1EQI4_ASPOF|nr:probable glycosyltransferase At5g25310 [Asparagus officinalis]ONK66290.1 uncharacterized protein A4U43_C06F6170 [Asparagus officinalis]